MRASLGRPFTTKKSVGVASRYRKAKKNPLFVLFHLILLLGLIYLGYGKNARALNIF